ncbi:cell surface protein, partial [Fusobacterium polymorphum]
MKKSVSLKLIVFSFLLVSGSIAYSATPTIQAGAGTDSTKAGINNDASGEESSAFGYSNKASEKRSSAF